IKRRRNFDMMSGTSGNYSIEVTIPEVTNSVTIH
ncbi:MAG: hypothetical protein QOK03_2235, partial [Candidatus Binataceae bacterium]|nr:hypothetical protein [Candidatus Binataceae bacterium]